MYCQLKYSVSLRQQTNIINQMEAIVNQLFKNKKTGVIYQLSNVVYNMDNSIHHISGCLSGFQIKNGKLYGRSRAFYPHQVEKITE